jgi:PHD/YefM family antitoxin component YafN of YafNO toxin-antitoxin module
MKQIELTADVALKHLLQEAEKEDIVLTRQGHAVALISPIDDEELTWYVRECAPEFLASIARARAQVQQGQTVGHDDLKRQLDLE